MYSVVPTSTGRPEAESVLASSVPSGALDSDYEVEFERVEADLVLLMRFPVGRTDEPTVVERGPLLRAIGPSRTDERGRDGESAEDVGAGLHLPVSKRGGLKLPESAEAGKPHPWLV